MKPQAYEMDGHVLCTDCALTATRQAFTLFQMLEMIETLPASMDEAILTLQVLDAISGEDNPMPMPYAQEGNCACTCGCSIYLPAVQEVS